MVHAPIMSTTVAAEMRRITGERDIQDPHFFIGLVVATDIRADDGRSPRTIPLGAARRTSTRLGCPAMERPAPRRRAWLHVIVGCMSSGKTAEVVRLLTRAGIAGQSVLLLTPTTDTRVPAGEIVSRTGTRYPSRVVSTSADIEDQVASLDPDVVGIEEAQFFDGDLPATIERVVRSGRTVIVSGLDQDFAGRPFGVVPELLARADEVTKLTAICVVCGGEATRTQRLRDGRPAHVDDELIVVGGIGDDAYEARCRACHEVPGA